ncbi:MAG: Rv3235 family protein [Tetrasphaera jenkinsii]|jgi:hypothetical protein|uniref:Uncharacterized protein n=1 Tax=Nostocoides jenkinsii Ben 74 TaxID=1193518 RepID=A0A077MA44_9MICO|nr:Rv3235 family protein [Tetrasphaera jenkinsii]MCI1260909.1 Rv3235 family protein [Tetrasphaera jenkinsii]CCI53459.1 conserved hypothetical protein [Tetrasphaera jenkinsii Ben 74]
MTRPLRMLPVPDGRPPALPPGMSGKGTSGVGTKSTMLAPLYAQETLAFDLRPDYDEPPPPPLGDLPDPADWARGVAQALIEVMGGVRPPASVVRLTSPQVYLAVSRRYGVAARRAGSPFTGGALTGRAAVRRLAVLRIRCSHTRADAAEVAVVIADGPRVRAMALELTGSGSQWRVTTLQIA